LGSGRVQTPPGRRKYGTPIDHQEKTYRYFLAAIGTRYHEPADRTADQSGAESDDPADPSATPPRCRRDATDPSAWPIPDATGVSQKRYREKSDSTRLPATRRVVSVHLGLQSRHGRTPEHVP